MSIGRRITVRPSTDQDDLHELNRANASAWQVRLWEAMVAASPDYPYVRLTGLLDGRPVGFVRATPAPVSQGGLGGGTVFVHPSARRQGVGTALWEALRDAVRPDCPGVQMGWSDRDPAGGAAARAWGLVETDRHVESVLDLTRPPGERPPPPGVVLRPLPQDADEQSWRELHAFLSERHVEAPDHADGGGDLPFEVFRGAVPEPWMVLLAEQDGAPVGVTCVCRRDGPDTANTFFTGVAPAARRRGLALALKSRHVGLLRERGVRRLYTQNMEGNVPILAANARLGFVPDAVSTDVVQTWSGPA